MLFNRNKKKYDPEKLREDLQSKEGYNRASDYIYERAIKNFQKIKAKYYKLGETTLEDVFQESVMITITNVSNGKLEDPSKLSAYYSRIFRNLCIDILRKKDSAKRKGYVVVPLDAGVLPEIGEDAYDAFAEAVAKEELENKTIEWLELSFKKCLRLLRMWVVERMSYEQIAKVEKMSSEGTVRSTVSQCKKKIRKKYREEA